jgi:hypothetical protein
MKIKIITLLIVVAVLAVVFLATAPALASSHICNQGAGEQYDLSPGVVKNRDIARCFTGDGTQLWRIVCSKGVTEVWVGSTVTASCTK